MAVRLQVNCRVAALLVARQAHPDLPGWRARMALTPIPFLSHRDASRHPACTQSHEIDLEMAIDLTEADLEEMGILRKGQRKTVMRALDNLRNWCMRASRQQYEKEQLFMGRYSVSGTADWGAYTVMTGTDAKTNRQICLKVWRRPACARFASKMACLNTLLDLLECARLNSL